MHVAELARCVTIREIARRYKVDPKTAHYWTTREWFPAPAGVRSMRGGTHPVYDPAEVQRARVNYRNRKRRRNA